jgi:hypothetical protein
MGDATSMVKIPTRLDHAHIVAVEIVASLSKAGGLEAVGLTEDEQFDAAAGALLVLE